MGFKETSELEYFYEKKYKCKFCDEEFYNINREHIEKYHKDEMDFEDHVKAHKDGKCGCSGVDIAL